MEGRELRSKKNVNYLELANLQLPSTRRKHHLDTSKLFSVHILETDEVDEEDSEDGSSVTSCFQPYSWYDVCKNQSSTVRIVMPFDVIQFSGGLKLCRVPSKKVRKFRT